MDEKIWRFGVSEGLEFEFIPAHPRHEEYDPSLIWGEGRLSLQGQVIWGVDDGRGEEMPMQWTWVEMLAFLGRSWPWLLQEESYPVPVNPLFPSYLPREAERWWEDMPESEIESKEEEVYRFLRRHDLATAMAGVYVPSLFLLRQGTRCLISCPATDQNLVRPLTETMHTLEAIGNCLAGLLPEAATPMAKEALELWQNREQRVRETAIVLRSGMEPETLAALLGDAPGEEFFEFDLADPLQDTELFAAARMSRGVLTTTGQKELLSRLREIPKQPTPELDALSVRAESELKEEGKAYEQGYQAARWLRRAMAMPPEALMNPEECLKDWGVMVVGVALPEFGLDAVAAWGPRHGPAILVNNAEGSMAAHPFRRRSTLAHEICHLLLDRQGALPAAEVLGGMTPEYPEKRARAFAAELLLPRQVVEQAVQHGEDLETVVNELREKYQVGWELIARQIQNSPIEAMLNNDERTLLNQLAGQMV
ncbi:ImmA/IrrE family metallo-endopeptidase [Desulfurivibrio alkaliphilus]|uniref:IrrE N-terminal-like domain-containing protein n=1 Tax=Desulfurivibrio alkaliphilus (strain DSM 19089 / UNIQEM U267 / AHT2) TaxID=589865 RepID=D6Z4R2_DESAT|nr:ImmA/IrrE family metallo-endopeptidase [Desulfurivibrio alkaliphilus]ADH86537.1 protein of unknown function DUF955 [Desulfurivibrio alkaliphilus AHT 2]